jgi:hypothetical protein
VENLDRGPRQRTDWNARLRGEWGSAARAETAGPEGSVDVGGGSRDRPGRAGPGRAGQQGERIAVAWTEFGALWCGGCARGGACVSVRARARAR